MAEKYADLKGRYILIVDDEPDLREIIKDELENIGCQVVCAENGHTAFEVVKTQKVDVVVSDIRMANGSGMELLEKIKSLPQAPQVILMTGFADISPEDAFDKGADALFAKPFGIRELIDAVENSLKPLKERLQRKHIRAPIKALVEICLPSLQHAKKGQTLNIGKGGFFLAVKDGRPSVGDSVQFNIAFDDGQTSSLKGTGICRWVRDIATPEGPAGYGVEFTELDESSFLFLEKLIKLSTPSAVIPKD